MQTIKIDIRDKGEFHWEDLLLKKQKARLEKLLTQLNVPPFKKRSIHRLSKKLVGRENIVQIYSHPIREFLHALLKGEVNKLQNYSSFEIVQL